jgi:hypothetical protein
VPAAGGGGGALGNLWRHALSSWSRDGEGTDDASLLELTDDDDDDDGEQRGCASSRGADVYESDSEDAEVRSLKSMATDFTPTTVEIDLDTCQIVRPDRRRVRFFLGPEAAAPASEAPPLGASAAERSVAAAAANISAAGEAGSARAADAGAPPETAEPGGDACQIDQPVGAIDVPLVEDHDGGAAAPASLSPGAQLGVDACELVPPSADANKDKTLVELDRSGDEASPVGLNDSGHTADLSFSSLSDAAEEDPADASSPAPVLEARLLPAADPPTTSNSGSEPEEKATSIACNLPDSARDEGALQPVPSRKPGAPCPAIAPSAFPSVGQGDVAAGGPG